MNKVMFEEIKVKMSSVLDERQLFKLDAVLSEVFNLNCEKKDFVQLFLFAKKSEGRSKRTAVYYSQVLRNFEASVEDIRYVTSDEVRSYLFSYQEKNKCSALTVDNIRRILSTFYIWMENEDYILKSPMRRIGKMKIPKIIKSVFADEQIVAMRENFSANSRNLAILDLLYSSGMRVGELVSLNRKDINLDAQTAIVYGKGAKEREVYFDVKTKMSLKKYLEERKDNLEALFIVSKNLRKKRNEGRISINQVERLIRDCGKVSCDVKAYPHKFRRTMATRAIDKGMPIEQVQVLLGHTKIDTTLHYAQVQQKNVRFAYMHYIA